MSERDTVIPRSGEPEENVEVETAKTEEKPQITQEEADIREKVFFEEDEKVRLRDGITYTIPPLGIKDARKLIKKLNTIDSGVIIANLIPEDGEEDRYDELLDILLMGFKPYYPKMTTDYLGDYVDVDAAAHIIDIMIGINGLKKSM